MKTIQGLENSAYVKDELKGFERSVLAKKNSFNKLYHENIIKEDKLEQLEKQLEMLVFQCDDYSEQQNCLKSKNIEYKTLHKKLKEQIQDQETLEKMLSTRKNEFGKMIENTNNKNKERNTIASQIEKYSKAELKYHNLISQYKKKIELEKKIIDKIEKQKENKIVAEVKNFADKKKFKYCMKREQEKNFMLEKHTNEAKQLLELEMKLSKMKENELLSKEIKEIEAHCVKEEKKFLEIQKVTNIVTVNDIYPHYMYLMDNEDRLKNSVNVALETIKNLSKERKNISDQLKNLRFKDLDSEYSIEEIHKMEEDLKKRSTFIENYEEYVEKLENVFVTATNSFSRLIYQLDLADEIVQLDPENLEESFKKCETKLDMLIEFIKKSEFNITESINTDINYRKSPNFLNLNTRLTRYK
jgi:DNA repair exonuclease SbcCD ATPase subunit